MYGQREILLDVTQGNSTPLIDKDGEGHNNVLAYQFGISNFNPTNEHIKIAKYAYEKALPDNFTKNSRFNANLYEWTGQVL